jgi:hypothetical protein
MAVIVQIKMFWVVTPYNLVDGYGYFGETHCFYLHGWSYFDAEDGSSMFYEKMVYINKTTRWYNPQKTAMSNYIVDIS